MVWTTPKTWNASDVLTATDMNVYVRDNQNYLYARLDEVAVSSTASSNITFAAIPQNYRHLLIEGVGRADGGALAPVYLLCNTDTGGNYGYTYGEASATNTTGNGATGQAMAEVARVSTGAAAGGTPGGFTLVLHNYTSTAFFKTFTGQSIDGVNMTLRSHGGCWQSTAPTTHLTLQLYNAKWVGGSLVTLYGLPA